MARILAGLQGDEEMKKIINKEQYKEMIKPKVNNILCEGVKGIFKDKQVELYIGPTAAESVLKVNGEMVHNIQAVHLSIRLGKPTRLFIEKNIIPE